MPSDAELAAINQQLKIDQERKVREDIQAARRVLRSWPMLVTLLVFPLTYFVLIHDTIPMLRGIMLFEPSIIIWPGTLGSLPVAVFMALVVLIALARAIPLDKRFVQAATSTMNWIGIWVLLPFVLCVLPLMYFLPSVVMPSLGYTKCSLKTGKPAMLSVHWIRNLDWCIKGKDREWVFEQAKLAEEKSAKPESAVMPAQAKQ